MIYLLIWKCFRRAHPRSGFKLSLLRKWSSTNIIMRSIRREEGERRGSCGMNNEIYR